MVEVLKRTGSDKVRTGPALSEPRTWKVSSTAAYITKSTSPPSMLQEVTIQVSQDTFAREGPRKL